MTTQTGPANLERFHKLVGLLGSEHEGERATAALKATAWLAERGLTWADVSVPATRASPGSDWEADEVELARRRMHAAMAAKADMRRRNKERWAQNAQQPDANGFSADLREDIRRATGGEDGLRDPRVRK